MHKFLLGCVALVLIAAGMLTERYTVNSAKLPEPAHTQFLVACATQTGATLSFCTCLEKEYVSKVGDNLEKSEQFDINGALQTCKTAGAAL